VLARLVYHQRLPFSESELDVALEVIETFVDDLDGGNADETVQFALDGASYEIDLNKKNAAAMRKAFARYLATARKSSSGRTPPRRRRPATSAGAAKRSRGYDIVQLREWASANDIPIPSRGRIPQAIVERYTAAGGR